MRKWLKIELSGWRFWEAAWLMFATVAILAISLILGDTPLGILASLTGTWCVVLTGKGKASNFVFGIVNVLLYAYISFEAALYGEVMLNLLYYLPCSVIGLVLWSRHTDDASGEVAKHRMPVRWMWIGGALTVAAVVAYGFALRAMGDALPFLDSTTTVLSVVAQILCLKRFAEQWILWIVINSASIAMWGIRFVTADDHVAVLLMWCVYLVNAVIMYVKWLRDVKRCDIE